MRLDEVHAFFGDVMETLQRRQPHQLGTGLSNGHAGGVEPDARKGANDARLTVEPPLTNCTPLVQKIVEVVSPKCR